MTEPVLGWCGNVLVIEGASGVVSVRSGWKFPPCPMKPMPGSSSMDPLLGDGGSIPGEIIKGKKVIVQVTTCGKN